MPLNVASIGQQMLQSRSLLERRPVQAALGILAITTTLSIALAPEADASTWDWIRLLAIAILGAFAVLVFASASMAGTTGPERQERLIGAAVLVGLALVLNLTFSVGTALLFSIGITLITFIAATDHQDRSAWTLAGALLVAIPAWSWSALDAWNSWLLLLVPLALIGIVSDGHMRAAVALPATVTSSLTQRGHRLGSWLGVLGMALIAFATGLLIDVDRGVVVLGAVGAIALVAIDAATPAAAGRNPGRSITLVDAALLWIALCWIVSL